ncbi:hypothetical protein ABZV78_25600, partial [Micromonospora sp. NPDC004540]
IVGVGGGLVRPMQGRWENWLTRAEQESQAIADHARAYQAGRRDVAAMPTMPPPAQPVTSHGAEASNEATMVLPEAGRANNYR